MALGQRYIIVPINNNNNILYSECMTLPSNVNTEVASRYAEQDLERLGVKSGLLYDYKYSSLWRVDFTPSPMWELLYRPNNDMGNQKIFKIISNINEAAIKEGWRNAY